MTPLSLILFYFTYIKNDNKNALRYKNSYLIKLSVRCSTRVFIGPNKYEKKQFGGTGNGILACIQQLSVCVATM